MRRTKTGYKAKLLSLGMLFLVFLFPGCISLPPYKFPLRGAPAARVKLNYAYLSHVPNTRLGLRLIIQEGDATRALAYEKFYGAVAERKERPALENASFRIHSGRSIVVSMRLWFFWSHDRRIMETKYISNMPHTRSKIVRDHYQRGCVASVRFTPFTNAMYLLDYMNAKIDRKCSLQIYEKVKLNDGTFELKPVGTAL